jgi:hypothetical protein
MLRRLRDLAEQALPVFTKPANFDHLLTALRRAMIRPIDPDPALGQAH